MKCPYCVEEINDDAIVCKHCQRDFYVIQPLMAKLKAATARVKLLEKKLHAAGLDPDGETPIKATPAPPTVAARAAVVVAIVDDHLPTLPVWLTVSLTFLFLIAAHFIIIIQLDLPLLYLRVASIGVPLAFGFFYRKSLDRWLGWDLVTGLVIAIASILAMSAIVARVDHVAWLPQDAAGWREYAEYAASIGFGFFTGCVLRHGLMVARSPSPSVSYLIELISRYIATKMKKKKEDGGDDEGDERAPKDKIDEQVKKIESLISGAIAAGSVAISIYTGLSGFLQK